MLSDCRYVIVSNALSHFQDRLLKKLNHLQLYKGEIVENILFFGLYNVIDFFRLRHFLKQRVRVHILWGGTDCHTLHNHRNVRKNQNDIDCICHYAISPDISNCLKEDGIPFEFLENFSLVEKEYFTKRETSEEKQPDKVYIYNGLQKGREDFFGKDFYEKVIEKLIRNYQFKEEQFIFSNSLNKKYSDMVHVYEKCFIGLRLCQKDGNSNTVEEFRCIGKPIIHKCSEYGISWENEYDIMESILTHYKALQHKIQS